MQLIQNPGYNSLLILIWEGSYCITFVYYRQFSGSSAFPQCQVILFFEHKGILFFDFLPCSFCWLLINLGIKEKNVRHGLLGVSIQTVKRPNKGCCLFC